MTFFTLLDFIVSKNHNIMKYILFITLCKSIGLIAQKPIMDSAAVVNWPLLVKEGAALSHDGNYFSFKILNQPAR